MTFRFDLHGVFRIACGLAVCVPVQMAIREMHGGPTLWSVFGAAIAAGVGVVGGQLLLDLFGGAPNG